MWWICICSNDFKGNQPFTCSGIFQKINQYPRCKCSGSKHHQAISSHDINPQYMVHGLLLIPCLQMPWLLQLPGHQQLGELTTGWIIFRADSRFAPSQWEMSLQRNAASHRLSTNLESALILNKHKSFFAIQWCWYMLNPWKKLEHLFWQVNTMATDDLVTQGARASAAIISTKLTRNIPLPTTLKPLI